MAARSNNAIRLRLHFDYPPPAVVDCRMCWLLVDLNTCRVVADLESVVRDRFGFSRGSIVNLFVEDCYLPHTESIYVVRDNDSVRVKVDYLPQVNGTSSSPDTLTENHRKRRRPAEKEEPSKDDVSVERKTKKRKKKNEESLERNDNLASGEERSKESHGKSREKKKKRKNDTTVTTKPAAPTKKLPVRVEQPVKSSKKAPVAQAVSSSDSSSTSSEEEEAPKKTAAQKPVQKMSTPASSKAHAATKPRQNKPPPPSSSSSETSSDEAPGVKPPPQSKAATTTAPKGKPSGEQAASGPPAAATQEQAACVAAPPSDNTEKTCSSSSEDEIKLVIRRPTHQLGLGAGSPSSGRGRGQNWHRGPGGRGRPEGRGGLRGPGGGFEFGSNGTTQPSLQTDVLTNSSVVLQGAAENVPKPDYSSMPLLAAPPQVGQKIAFKLLELTENYTPEVSDYKEGKIVSFDPTTCQIELEMQKVSLAPAEPGKFDLVYQNPDGSERVEYAVTRGSLVTERWDSLLEPRLIIEVHNTG